MIEKFSKWIRGATTAAGVLCPAALPVVGIINSLLPKEKHLPKDASPEHVESVYNSLGPKQQAQVMERVEVELAEIQASVDKLEAMVSVEEKATNCRPYIAMMMAGVTCLAISAAMVMWLRAVWVGDTGSLAQLKESWELMLVLLATPTALLKAYFGMRTNEKTARYQAAVGQQVQNNGGVLSNLIGAFKK